MRKSSLNQKFYNIKESANQRPKGNKFIFAGWNYLSIPKLNFNGCNRWSLGMDKCFHPTVYNGCDYLSMLGLKLNHVSKRAPCSMASNYLSQHGLLLDTTQGAHFGDIVIDTEHVSENIVSKWRPLSIGLGVLSSLHRRILIQEQLLTVQCCGIKYSKATRS